MKVSNTFPHFYFPCTLYQSPISIPHYAGPKAIKVWPYNQHKGGGSHHIGEKIHFLGAWQGIYLCEHRNHGGGGRRLIITLTGATA